MKKNIRSIIIIGLAFLIFPNQNLYAQDNLPIGNYYIRLFNYNLYLDADINHQTENGGKVQLWNYAGGKNQQWRIVRQPNGLYRIYLLSTGKSLDGDIASGSLQIGSKIQIWQDWGGPNQLWNIVNVEPGAYVIKSAGNNLNLCVEANSNPNYAGRYKNGCVIDLWDYQGLDAHNEIWMIIPSHLSNADNNRPQPCHTIDDNN